MRFDPSQCRARAFSDGTETPQHGISHTVKAPISRTTVVVAVLALGALAFALYVHHASAERCFKAFQSIWIVFLFLLLVGTARGRWEPDIRTPLTDSRESRWICSQGSSLRCSHMSERCTSILSAMITRC